MAAAAAVSNNEAREQFYPTFHVRALPGELPLEAARRISDAHHVLPIWSTDVPNPQGKKDLKGTKYFDVASYAFWKEKYVALQPQDRCSYEILREGLPTRLYVDVDMGRALNPDVDDAVVAEHIASLVEAVRTLANEIRNTPDAPLEYTVLDSTSSTKLSKHLVFELFLTNNYHCGAFMRRVRDALVRGNEKEGGVGDRDNDHPFYLWTHVADPTKPKSGILIRKRTFFADLKVYTERRNFRLYASQKRVEGSLPLIHEGATHGIDWGIYDKCLLQRYTDEPVWPCLESDGSEPDSTSDEHKLRTDAEALASVAPAPATRKRSGGGAAAGPAQPARHLANHWQTIYPYQALFGYLAPPTPPPWATKDSVWKRDFRFVDTNDKWSMERTFDSHQDLRTATRKVLPATLHVGGVVEVGAAAAAASAGPEEVWQPTLAFDIDIRDYASFRPCCGDTASACGTCWPIAEFAQRALNAFIANMQLGVPVHFFSGSKGVHTWVLDTQDNALKHASRKNRGYLLGLFNSVLGTESTTTPPIPDTKATLTPFAQNALGTNEYRRGLRTFVCDTMGLREAFERHEVVHGADSALLHVLWPRVDEQVTTVPGHKIKGPFCVHPRTSRVCVWLNDPTVNPYTDDINVDTNAEEMTLFVFKAVA